MLTIFCYLLASLGTESKIEIFKAYRNFILVKERDGSIGRYVREKKSEENKKGGQRNVPNVLQQQQSALAENRIPDLRECKIVLQNMSKEDIASKIAEVEGKNSNHGPAENNDDSLCQLFSNISLGTEAKKSSTDLMVPTGSKNEIVSNFERNDVGDFIVTITQGRANITLSVAHGVLPSFGTISAGQVVDLRGGLDWKVNVFNGVENRTFYIARNVLCQLFSNFSLGTAAKKFSTDLMVPTLD